jgi:hypothetical protein
LCQGVLEDIDGLCRLRPGLEKLQPLQHLELRGEGFRALLQALQQRHGDLLAKNGSRLQGLFGGRRQPVYPGHQHPLNGFRHRQVRPQGACSTAVQVSSSRNSAALAVTVQVAEAPVPEAGGGAPPARQSNSRGHGACG